MNIEEDVEHLKELQEELDYIVEHDNTHKALNSHRKSMAISIVLYEFKRLQKENKVLLERLKGEM